MNCLLFLLLCLVIVSGAVEEEMKDPCTQPFGEAGPCRARIIRYGLDPQTGKCKKFFYGGCYGNGNNFPSRSKCKKRCKG